MSNFNGNPAEVLNDEEKRERSVFLFDSIHKFSDTVWPRIANMLSIAKTNNGDLDQVQKKELVTLLGDIVTNPCLNIANLSYLKSIDRSLVTQAEHDLNNFSIAISHVSTIRGEIVGGKQLNTAEDTAVSLSDIAVVYENWPGFAIALEDVLLHEQKLEETESVEQKPLDLDFFVAGMTQLIKSGAVEGRVKKMFAGQKLPDCSGILKEDEEVISQIAVVGNLIFNFCRNSAKEKIDAKSFNFSVNREGDELVLRVIDDGNGMEAELLDPNSPKFIFGKGKQSSHTGSSGIGLADAPQRLDKFANAKLRVWSRPRMDINAPYNTFPPDNQDEVPVMMMDTKKDDSATNFVSTIFEIRLPITKKAA